MGRSSGTWNRRHFLPRGDCLKVYSVGILGFGFIGKVHAYGYLNLPLFYDPPPLRRGSRTSSPAGRRRPRRPGRPLAPTWRPPTTAPSPRIPQIDIVHISTPNHLHKEALLSAIAHQKHIYCDKPLVATMAEAEEIQAALAGYRGIAQMTFQNRFFPGDDAGQATDRGRGAGPRCSVSASATCTAAAPIPTAPLKWKLTAGGRRRRDRRPGLPRAGPGGLAHRSVRVVDGRHADRLSRAARAGDPAEKLPVDVEDCVMLLAKMRSGALGTIEATKIATGTEDEIRLEIHGTRGALRFNGMDPHHLEFHDATAPDAPLGGLRGWNRIDAGQRIRPRPAVFPAPRRPRLDSQPRGLPGEFPASRRRRPAGRAGARARDSRAALMECVRRSAAEKRWVDV